MIKTTRWSPDTCDCIIEYQWNTDQPEESREHTASAIVRKCEAHQSASDPSEILSTISDENQRKNIAIQRIIDGVPEVAQDALDASGSTIKELRSDKKVNWSFDENRNLVLDLEGFTQSEKTKAQAEISKENRVKDKTSIR